MPESEKLRDGLKEDLLLSPSYGEGRASASERFKARRASVRRKPTDALGTEHAPATLLELVVGKPLLALEFHLDGFTRYSFRSKKNAQRFAPRARVFGCKVPR